MKKKSKTRKINVKQIYWHYNSYTPKVKAVLSSISTVHNVNVSYSTFFLTFDISLIPGTWWYLLEKMNFKLSLFSLGLALSRFYWL